MPLTPFIGLSVLVHIGIILGYYFFRWIPRAKPRISRIHPSVNRCFSFIIIFLVFVFVVTNATLLLKASLNSEYSSVKIASHYVGKALAFASSTSDDADNQILGKITNTQGIIDCPKSYSQILAEYNGSLVDYLNSKHVASSFEAREVIAKSFGINGYNGMAEENLLIFQEMVKNFGDVDSGKFTGCST